VIASFPTCPVAEVARLGRTLRAWRAQVLAYFDTGGVSNGGTEAINLLIGKTRRLAHGFRNFHHYRLRILLAAGGTRRYRRAPIHADDPTCLRVRHTTRDQPRELLPLRRLRRRPGRPRTIATPEHLRCCDDR